MRPHLIALLIGSEMRASGDVCDLLGAGYGPDPGLVHVHQQEYLQTAQKTCIVHNSIAAETVRFLRGNQRCPTAWAITCLDHFNCKDILRDVSEGLQYGLASLGYRDVVIGLASECLESVPSCFKRQHLVLNANLMNAHWASVLPQASILVNLEQLVAYPLSGAIIAAHTAATDPRGDNAVTDAGKSALKAALIHPPDERIIGVTVDDYRNFVALHPESRNYPWLEYSYRNADLVKKSNQPCVFIKPIGVANRPKQGGGNVRAEIDFLHVGGIYTPRRRHVFSALNNAGWQGVIAEGYFSEARNRILQLAKVGINIHRHSKRRVAEVVRLLMYAASGVLIISERGDNASKHDSMSSSYDTLLEMELQTAVLFVPYSWLPYCASALLQQNTEANNARRRLFENNAKLLLARQEAQLLAPTLSVLFPRCHFFTPKRLKVEMCMSVY